MEPLYKARQLVEVSGLKDEGFPGSFVLAVVLKADSKGVTVQYMEFVDDNTKMQLEEYIELNRLRPALPPSAAHFNNWEQLQIGMCVDYHQDDVWWKGVVIRKTPAGVHVYMPDVDHSTTFVRLLKNLRPAYDWVTHNSSSNSSISSKQQHGHWMLRQLSKQQLMTMFHGAGDAKTKHEQLPSRLEYEPTYSEFTLVNSSTDKASPAAAPPPAAAAAAAVQASDDEDDEHLQAAVAGAQGHLQTQQQPQCTEKATKQDHAEQQNMQLNNNSHAAAADVQQEEQQQEDQQDTDNDEEQQLPAAAAAMPRKRQMSRSPVRRSSRSVKKRVVYVNNLPVLRDNLYGPEGEPSVFDRELAGVTPGSDLPTELPLSPAAKMKQQQLQHMRQQRQQQQQQREQRCLSPGKPPKGPTSSSGTTRGRQTAAQQHNAGVKADMQAISQIRSAYLATHLDKLKPFISPAVSDALDRAAAAAPPGLLSSLPAAPDHQPDQIKAVLREYQLEGLAWLVAQHHRGLNSILADEMGLGKTLQTITFLADLKFRLGVCGPHLIVVPLSVMSSWMTEFNRWCPSLRVIRLHTPDQEERKRLRKEVLSHPDSFDVALTTYEMVSSNDFGRIIQSTLRWRYLVLDEGHRVRNLDTLTAAALKRVQTSRVLLLTGTPLQNNMVELFGLLSFLYPDIFTTPGPFEAAFNLSKGQVDTSALSAAHYLLRPFCLRRLKEEVELTLPPKVETRIAVPLAPQQIFWYRRLLLHNHEALSALESAVVSSGSSGPKQSSQPPAVTDSNAWRKLQNLLIQLRKIVDHPFLMPDSEPGGEGTATLRELLDASGKLSVLDRLLVRLKSRGHRVVLFSQFTMMMDILEDYLEQAGFEYTRLDGSVNRVQRMINISQFMKADSKMFVFLASTRAGGLGLNLQAADTVILYDSDWNPQWDMQAMARVHRIGQTRPVHVYRLVTSSSVEERMLQRADAKLYLDQMVNRGSTAKAQQLDGVSGGELLSMLSFGADRVLANEAGQPPSDQELENILDRSRHTAAAAAAVDSSSGDATMSRSGSSESPAAAAAAAVRSVQLTAANFKPAAPPPSTFTLNGVDYSREALNKLRQEAAAEAAAAVRRSSSSSSSIPNYLKKLSYDNHSEDGVKATLKQIAREYWERQEKLKLELQEQGQAQRLHPARSREARLMNVDGYDVLKSNNYTFEQGGRSAWEETRAGVKPANGGNPPKRKLQKAGRDYAHSDTCQVCWDGGDLICCDVCPAAYHAECIGQDLDALARCHHWACPHHSCAACGRGPAAAGGLLFKCCVCENSWCEDHLPADQEIVGEWELFQALGQNHPSNACFIFCGPDCVERHNRLKPQIQQTIKTYTDNPELRFKEAVQDNAGNKKAVKKAKKKT